MNFRKKFVNEIVQTMAAAILQLHLSRMVLSDWPLGNNSIVEFIQFFRKKPFPQRMKTGAWWGVVTMTLIMYGQLPAEKITWPALLVSLAVAGMGALVVYVVRLLAAKAWGSLLTKEDKASN